MQNVNPYIPYRPGRDPYLIAAPIVFLLLLLIGGYAYGERERLNSALVREIERDNKPAVRRLLLLGADPNARSEKMWFFHPRRQPTKGQFAAVTDYWERFTNKRTKRGGATALMHAVYRGDKEMVELLLDSGAEVDVSTRFGTTPLFLSTFVGNTKVSKQLLDAGANPNARSWQGNTPLIASSLRGNPEMVRLLLARGADANATNQQGVSPLSSAQQFGHTQIVKLLLQAGAK